MADAAGAFMPSGPGPAAVTVPQRQNWGRRSFRPPQRWLELAVAASLFIHGMILAIVLLAKHLPTTPPPPPPEQGMEMVFEHGQQSPHAAPHPSRFIEIPRGAETGSVEQRPVPQTPPPQPRAMQAPQVNLLPPEMQAPPLPPTAHAEPTPAPSRAERQEKAHRRSTPQTNPFAHMALPNFAARPPSHARGLRNSRSFDLSMGPVIEGGQLKDAVPHIASPGADGDYMELLSEYVETHKYYPEEAGRNGEQGTATIKALIARDGTVKDVRLEQSSDSRMLDVALLSMFRDKHLPPFPDDMKENEREFTITMTYEIVY
jgi:TonB family protein